MQVKRHKHRRLSKLELTLNPMIKLVSGRKGKAYRHVIGAKIDNDREYTLHATKGYRSGRA